MVAREQVQATGPLLNLHMEPEGPIEVGELTAALGSISRLYQRFIAEEGPLVDKQGGARLFVSSVAPGSIDISFLPDFHTLASDSVLLITMGWDQLVLVMKFAARIKRLLDFFSGAVGEKPRTEITAKDCDDTTNIVNPIAQHGGSQTFNIINAPAVTHVVLKMGAEEARRILEGAAEYKTTLLPSGIERRQRVAMVWSRLDRDDAKVGGKRSPDHGIIEDIDPRPRPVFLRMRCHT